MTRLEVFMKRYPDACMEDGLPAVAPCLMGFVDSMSVECNSTICFLCREKYWGMEEGTEPTRLDKNNRKL